MASTSLFFGKAAGNNPFKATGLEWQTSSPPSPHNFESTPEVYFGPYEYAVADGLKIIPLNDGTVHDIVHEDPDLVSSHEPAKEATHGS